MQRYFSKSENTENYKEGEWIKVHKDKMLPKEWNKHSPQTKFGS